MQNPITLKNREIRLLAATLPQGNVIVSVDNPDEFVKPNHVCVADAYDAARCIVYKTHRFARQEEIETYFAEEAKRAERILARERARKADFNINVQVPSAVSEPVKLNLEEPLIERKKRQ